MKRWQRMLAITGATAAVVLAACAGGVYALGPAPLGQNLEYSHVVLDREGRLLRAYATREGRWRLPVVVKDVDPRFLRLLFVYEDKRFYDHNGIDYFRVMGAVVANIKAGGFEEGFSTITMQLARNIFPERLTREKTPIRKLREAKVARQIEKRFSKERILELYLNKVYFGDGFYGVDIKEINGRYMVMEVNDNPSVDAGYEDAVYKDQLYNSVMQTFLDRLELRRR